MTAKIIITLFLKDSDRQYDISLASIYEGEAITIQEDAIFKIEFISSDENDGTKIELGDIPLQLHRMGEMTSIKLSSSKDRHLANYFGKCPLRIYLPKSDEWLNVVHFDVLARKANAAQAEALLAALSQKGEDILRYCFSKTSYGADHKNAVHSDPNLILLQAERIILYLAKNRSYFRNNHRSRLVSKEIISSKSENPPIDDASLSWIFHNFDQLVISDRLDFDLILRGWKYNFANINHIALVEESNVYENQVVFSLLLSVKERLSAYVQNAKHIEIEADEPLAGYVSLNELLRRFLPVTGFWRDRCKQLIAECNTLIMFFQKNLPCEAVHDLRPVVTPFVRGNQTYRQIFSFADRWYSLGRPDWSGQEYLVNLLSLPRLYEFFCLLSLVDILSECGFTLLSKDFRTYLSYSDQWGKIEERPPGLPLNHYLFSRNGVEVELFFEPKIWAFRDFSENGRLVDLSHSPTGKNAFRTPDFLLRISAEGIRTKYLYCDSKYSTPSSIREWHLPQLTEKYLLQTGEIDAQLRVISQTACLGIFALHPSSLSHSDSTSVVNPKNLIAKFGPTRHVVIPSLASIELAPLKQSEFNVAFENILRVAFSDPTGIAAAA